MPVGRQIEEAVVVHQRVGRVEARRRALAMLESVRIRDPERVYAIYPHQVSGGMGQRIMIAMMLVTGPDLLALLIFLVAVAGLTLARSRTTLD